MRTRSFLYILLPAAFLSLLLIACSAEISEPNIEVIVNSEAYSNLALHDVYFVWNYNRDLDDFTYVMVDEESDILPFIAPRARLMYMEYDIPIERITQIICAEETGEVHFISLDDDIHILRGYPGSWLNNGVSIDVVGIDSSGSQVTITLSPASPADIEFVSAGAFEIDFDPNSYQYVGTAITWDGETYPIIENVLEPLEFRQGDDSQFIGWEDVQKVQVLEDRLAQMIEKGVTISPYWSYAVITLVDDQTLEGQIKSQKGYVTGVRQDGLLVRMKLHAVREISISR